MEQILINIEKYRFAIFGTLLFHILVFVISGFTPVQHVSRLSPPEVTIEVPLDEIEFEPEIEEILELNKEPIASQNVTNAIRDANDTRKRSLENYSTNKVETDQEVLDRIKEEEAQMFAEANSNNPNVRTTQDNESSVNEEKKETKNNNNDNENSSGGENAIAGEVMISFNLPGRIKHHLGNPGYTCNGSATIVIQIKVDGSGYVKDVKYLSQASSSATDCMIQSALKYARKSSFDLNAGSSMQTGTITYKFIAG